MRRLTPHKHSIPILIILTLSTMVGAVSLYALGPSQPDNRHWGIGMLILSLSLSIPVAAFMTHRPVCNNKGLTDYRKILTDFRYIRFAIAAGAAFAGSFVFVAGGGFVFINQLKLSAMAYTAMFAIVIASYLLSAIAGTRLTRSMSRSQSSMLAASLMLMGAVTCVGSSILTNGKSVPGYLLGIIIYKLGAGFFIPQCQHRAIEHMTENTGIAANLMIFIAVLMAGLVSALAGRLPEAGTLPISMITLVSIGITTLCLLGVDRERDTGTPQVT